MKKKFGGKLDIPIEPRKIGLLLNGQQVKELKATWHKEDAAKLRLLCKHYGIHESVSMYYELSLALAREIVPGFKEKVKRGRKSKWDDLTKGLLVVEIKRLIKPKSKEYGATWAATQLAKREPWKSFIEAKDTEDTDANPAEVLRTKYAAFKDDTFARIARDAFKLHKRNGTVADWDRQLAYVLNKRLPKRPAVYK
jgi:hypothetical protein